MGLVARDGDSVLQNSPRPVDGARQSVTFETIKCRTLNSARLWEASMCQSDQPRVSGVVVLDSTQPRRCVRADLIKNRGNVVTGPLLDNHPLVHW